MAIVKRLTLLSNGSTSAEVHGDYMPHDLTGWDACLPPQFHRDERVVLREASFFYPGAEPAESLAGRMVSRRPGDLLGLITGSRILMTPEEWCSRIYKVAVPVRRELLVYADDEALVPEAVGTWSGEIQLLLDNPRPERGALLLASFSLEAQR